MLYQEVIKKFTRRARADFRWSVRMGLLRTQPAFQAGLRAGVVISTLAQAKREHPHLTGKQIFNLENKLLDALAALVPPPCTHSDETTPEAGSNV